MLFHIHYAKLLQSCPTLCDAMDCSPPGSGGESTRFPPPGDLPDPGIKPAFLVSPALAGRFFTTSATWETLSYTLGRLREKTQTIASVDKDAETLRIENEYLCLQGRKRKRSYQQR